MWKLVIKIVFEKNFPAMDFSTNLASFLFFSLQLGNHESSISQDCTVNLKNMFALYNYFSQFTFSCRIWIMLHKFIYFENVCMCIKLFAIINSSILLCVCLFLIWVNNSTLNHKSKILKNIYPPTRIGDLPKVTR